MSFTTKKVNAFDNLGNLAEGDVLLGEKTSGTTGLITFNGSAISSVVDHDSLLNFVANEHIDWTSATDNFVTTGTAATGALTVTGNISVSGTVDGRDVATDGTKLDGVEALADVTDEANVTSALDGATLTAVTVAGTDKVLIQDADDSDNLKTVTAQSVADLASSSPGGSDTQVQYNNAGSFGGISQMTYNGTNVALTTGFSIDGTADEIQLKVQGHSTQTANIFEIENSAATNLVTVANSGATNINGALTATSYGGITEANLVDKSASESITGSWDFGGAASLEIPNGAAPTVDAAGEIAVDTTITDYTGLIKYHDGTEELTVVGMPTANLSTTDGEAVIYNATNNEFEMGNGVGTVIQVVETTDTTGASTTNTWGFDDTIPQSSEGAEFITRSITPTSSTNTLIIDFFSPTNVCTASGAIMVALFQDATADALAAATVLSGSLTGVSSLTYKMAAGTTSSTTFKIRFAATTGTAYINSFTSGHLYGAAGIARLRITELKI